MSSTTPPTQPTQPVPLISIDPSVAALFETITKMATLLVVGSYAIGYLIIVINDNAHGFLETSLIKPRAITAGAIFVLLTALPISLTQGTFFGKGADPESTLEMCTRLLLGLVDYLAACFVAGLMMLLVFTDDFHGAPVTGGKAIAFLALIYVISANGLVRFAAAKSYRRRPRTWVTFSILCLAGLAVAVYALRGLTIMKCWAWMFGITTLVNPYLSDIRRGIRLQFKVTALAGFLLGAVSVYSVYLFPFMKATWGGGAPVSTAIYLSKDSPIHPSQKVNAALFEASDSGFYVIFEGDEKATYVPKTSVTAMEFPPPSHH